MAFDIKCLITNEGKRRQAEQILGKNFILVGFALAVGGYDPNDPTIALTPNPDQTELTDVVYGPRSISGVTFANDQCPIVQCSVPPGEGVTMFSQVYILGQVITSPVQDDPEIGLVFLYAIFNCPRRPKLDTEDLVILAGFQS
jgi:hypothetical protein